MPKNLSRKIFSLVLFLSLLFPFSSINSLAQSTDEPVLIPLENLEFTPNRDQLTEPGVDDIQVRLGDFLPISNNSTCRFTFSQIGLDGEAIQTSEYFVENTYFNRSCAGTLTRDRQIAKNITVSLVVTSPDGQTFGSYLGFIIGQNTEDLIVNPFEYSLPPELTTKPEINIRIARSKLQVGDTTTIQVEISNRDEFALQGFSFDAIVPDQIGRIDCESFEFTENVLDGEIIKNPFAPIKAFAQTEDQAGCGSDEYGFQLTLASLSPGRTTRLNFDITMEKDGDFRLDFTTNLDQKDVSKQTSNIAIILPEQDSTEAFPTWFIGVIVALVVLILAGLGYWLYRYIKGKKDAKLNIKI